MRLHAIALGALAASVVQANLGKVSDAMVAAGSWVFAGGLRPSQATTVVRPARGTTTMTDGPFAETKEQLGGFWVIRCADLDEALSWADKCALACGCPIEVRPCTPATGRSTAGAWPR